MPGTQQCVGTACVTPLGLGEVCDETSVCVAGSDCCPAGSARAGHRGIATGDPYPINAGSPSNNACCSLSCVGDAHVPTSAICHEPQGNGGTCDPGDVADCQAGLSCCIVDGSPTGFGCCGAG